MIVGVELSFQYVPRYVEEAYCLNGSWRIWARWYFKTTDVVPLIALSGLDGDLNIASTPLINFKHASVVRRFV